MSPSAPACPSSRDLQRFLEGELLEADAQVVDLHVTSCPVCTEALEQLNRMPGGLLGIVVNLPTGDCAVGEGPLDIAGYQVLEQVGAGGMGVIYRARHETLGRVLALKVLRHEFSSMPELRERFLTETRVNAGLQHPCIVPVHETGSTADGRPYFSMKLVGGETLESRLAKRHGDKHDLSDLLRIFELVCQGVAYAHDQSVIHRDLKPGNIMVGDFGEVQVMDWGLAKRLNERVESPAIYDASVGYEGAFRYQTRRALGTYAYMPPEQARAEIDQQDQRCDVFSLGAILCHILTGAPVYVETANATVKHQAEAAELSAAWARLDGCGADVELVSLAKSCLSVRRDARPASAAKLAEAICAYRAQTEDRLRAAEAAQAAAQIQSTEERKRRRLAVALATLVVALIVLLVGGFRWKQHADAAKRQEHEQQGQRLLMALEQAEMALDRGRWSEAEAAIKQVPPALVQSHLPDAAKRVDVVQQQVDFVSRLDELAELRLARGEDAIRPEDYFEKVDQAFQAIGVDVVAGDLHQLGDRIRSLRISAAVISLLDQCAGLLQDGAQTRRISELATRAEPQPSAWKSAVRDTDNWRQRAALEELLNETPWNVASPSLLVLLANKWRDLGGDPCPYLRRSQQAHPDDFWINTTLGQSLAGGAMGGPKDPRVVAEMASYFRAALAVRPHSLAARSQLGLALTWAGQFDEAQSLLVEAKEQAPDHYRVHLNLGVLLERSGKPMEALEAYRESLRIKPKHATTLYRIGLALETLGQTDQAAAAYQESIDVEPHHADVWFALGNTRLSQQNWCAAIEAYREAIKIDDQTSALHGNLSIALRNVGDLDNATHAARRAVSLSPDRKSFVILGNALKARGNDEEAELCFRKAASMDPK